MGAQVARQEEIKPLKHNPGVKGIPIEDILELRNKQLTLKQIGAILNCSIGNVSQRLKAHEPTFLKLERFKKHRADALTLTQARLLNSITDKDIESASLLQRTTALGILHDKERLERGQSTANVALSICSLVERLDAEGAAIRPPGTEVIEEPGIPEDPPA